MCTDLPRGPMKTHRDAEGFVKSQRNARVAVEHHADQALQFQLVQQHHVCKVGCWEL